MRFSTIASAAAIAPALVSAASLADLKNNLGSARVHNRCDYPVYLWSVKKDMGCSAAAMKTLKPGESYSEVYRDDHSDVGVSIKISKTQQCKGNDITQLEYHINHASELYHHNYLDVSFVDCIGETCPGRDGFYLKSGNNGDERLATQGEDKAICPIISCDSLESCGNPRAADNLYDVYINWDDRATKTCEPAADTDFYLCVSSPDEEAPKQEEEDEEKPAPSSSEKEEVATPTLDVAAKAKEVNAAQITSAPEKPVNEKPNVKTEVVYVTQYEYVNAKRHAHGHRHQHFRA
jgi:hypothetical protein